MRYLFLALLPFHLFAAGVWSDPLEIDTPGSSAASYVFQINNQNQAVSVWSDGLTNNVYVNFYNDESWQINSTLLADTSEGHTPNLDAALNDEELVLLAYESRTEEGLIQIYGAYGNGIEGWSQSLISAVDTYGSNPSVSLNSSSQGILAWKGEANEIYGRIFFEGEYGSITEISATGANVSFPKAGIDDMGRGWITWYVRDEQTIYASYSTEDEWSPPEVVATSIVNAGALQIHVNATGSVMVTWQDADGGASALNTGEGWTIHRIVPDTGFLLNTDFNDDETAIAVWRGETAIIYASRFTGTEWSTPERISSTEGFNSSPYVSLRNNNTAIAAWTNGSGILTNQFTGTNWLGFEIALPGSTFSGPRVSATGEDLGGLLGVIDATFFSTFLEDPPPINGTVIGHGFFQKNQYGIAWQMTGDFSMIHVYEGTSTIPILSIPAGENMVLFPQERYKPSQNYYIVGETNVGQTTGRILVLP